MNTADNTAGTGPAGGMVLLVAELVVSLVVLIGGGYLLTIPAFSQQWGGAAWALIGAVGAYWFSRRQQDASTATLQNALQQAIAAAVQAVVPPPPAHPALPAKPATEEAKPGVAGS